MSTLSHRSLGVVLAGLLAVGCTTLPPDGGFGPVQEAARSRAGVEAAWARSDAEAEGLRARAAAILAKGPLSIDDAVQVAVLNNRGLQASFAELGIVGSDLLQSGRLPNPRLSIHRIPDEHHYKLEQALSFNVLSLALMPLATEIEQRRFAAAQQRASLEVLRLAADTRRAWVQAVAANETLAYLRQVKLAADAGAELAARMAKAGNFNALARAREQGFYSDAVLAVARGEQAANVAREHLTRLLGLWGEATAFALPERLPDLPAVARDRPDIEREAVAGRLDVRAAVSDTEALARNLGLTRTTRFVNVLEVGVSREKEGRDEPWIRGYDISLELPLFDWGTARVAKAEAIYRQSLDRAAQVAIEARSEVREAYRHYRLAHDIAKHYRDEIVPLRKKVAEENLLRYNGMLIGVFDLLADARAQILSVTGYVDALRDYWLAEANLRMAMIGRPVAAAIAAPARAAPEPAGGH